MKFLRYYSYSPAVAASFVCVVERKNRFLTTEKQDDLHSPSVECAQREIEIEENIMSLEWKLKKPTEKSLFVPF
jgi:hypothetical protein